MPEGPEVFITTTFLQQQLQGKVVIAITATTIYDNVVNDLIPITFPLQVVRVGCKGKQLFMVWKEIETNKYWYVMNHLGMTGYWALHKDAHNHFSITTACGTNLYFHDSRRVGRLEITDNERKYRMAVNGLAPSFLGDYLPLVTLDSFTAAIKKKKGSVVTALMDQRALCSGVGNYILSEVLHSSSLHPNATCPSLTDEKISLLFSSISSLMQRAVKEGETTIEKEYRDSSFMASLEVYNKKITSDGRKVMTMKGKHGRTIHYVASQ